MSRHLLLPVCIALAVRSFAQEPPVYSRVSIALDGDGHGPYQLAALGLPLDHSEFTGSAFIVELSASDIDLVRANGFDVHVVIPDMKRWYREQDAAGAPAEDRALGWLCDGPTTYAVPAHFNTGSMGGYFTWDEMLAELDEMVDLYPGLISAKSPIGSSLENRPIHFVRISNAPNQNQDKPEVLYTAVHHAREPASMSQLIFYMWWLLENYGTDAEATYLVDNRELYFVPCINPDGYVYNQNTDPDGGGMWRKNRRVNGDGSFGVDLNRNYGWLWGYDDQGSSPDGNSEVYRGTEGFSEPETQAIRDFCALHEFRAALNYHSHGDMVIHPWGSQPDLLTPDSALFTAHADRITRNNGYSRGTCQQVLYYLTNGSSDDWMYGEQGEKPKIMAMTPETGQADEGFWPPSWRIIPLCQENMDQNLMQAHLVGAYAAATDRSYPIFSQFVADAHFSVQRLGMDTATITVAIEPLENVVSVGEPKVFEDMDLLETRADWITIQLDPTMIDGDRVRFVLAVSNGLYTHRDTVERRYGVPNTIFTETAENMDNWAGQAWGLSTEQWHSPPASITDSPDGNYGAFQENTMTLQQPLDLTNATSAALRFWARWDISQIRDLLEVSASTNGDTWTPLCGDRTRPGSYFQGNDAPVYEGRQFDWVEEEMSLDDFIGGDVLLRFRLLSQMDFTRDGFYLDDLEVVTTEETASSIGAIAPMSRGLSCVPNPASDKVLLRSDVPVGDGSRLAVYDAVGALHHELPFTGRSMELDVRRFAEGSYTCVLRNAGTPVQIARLVIAR